MAEDTLKTYVARAMLGGDTDHDLMERLSEHPEAALEHLAARALDALFLSPDCKFPVCSASHAGGCRDCPTFED